MSESILSVSPSFMDVPSGFSTTSTSVSVPASSCSGLATLGLITSLNSFSNAFFKLRFPEITLSIANKGDTFLASFRYQVKVTPLSSSTGTVVSDFSEVTQVTTNQTISKVLPECIVICPLGSLGKLYLETPSDNHIPYQCTIKVPAFTLVIEEFIF